MQQSITIGIEYPIRRIVLDLRRRWILRRLSKGLSCLTNEDLVDLLAKAGMRRSELFMNFKGNTATPLAEMSFHRLTGGHRQLR